MDNTKVDNKKYIENEMNEMMNRINQSDKILCHNIENLHFAHKRDNDTSYMFGLSRTMPNKIRDVSQEYQMLTHTFATRVANCTEDILKRGGNNVVPDLSSCGGYECFKPCYTKEYQMIPCKENTFKNYLVSDDKKTCSSSHQLFNNLTKRV
jgi:hypothetical protein